MCRLRSRTLRGADGISRTRHERKRNEVVGWHSTEIDFAGHRCVEVTHPSGERLLVTVDKGPRVMGYITASGENLFAVLPSAGIDGPGGRFEFHGGHRLWLAPEVPEITYLPDDAAASVEEAARALVVRAPDNGSGIERVLTIEATAAGFAVDHRLVNVAATARGAVAAWAITQLPAPGIAIVPLGPIAEAHPLQASHSLVLWPYTNPADPRLRFGSNHVLVEATGESAPLKIGVRPGAGHLGYLRDGWLFLKKSHPPMGAVPDLGAASQVYTTKGYLELESLGSLEVLPPGQSLSHREEWSVLEVESLEEAVTAVP